MVTFEERRRQKTRLALQRETSRARQLSMEDGSFKTAIHAVEQVRRAEELDAIEQVRRAEELDAVEQVRAYERRGSSSPSSSEGSESSLDLSPPDEAAPQQRDITPRRKSRPTTRMLPSMTARRRDRLQKAALDIASGRSAGDSPRQALDATNTLQDVGVPEERNFAQDNGEEELRCALAREDGQRHYQHLTRPSAAVSEDNEAAEPDEPSPLKDALPTVSPAVPLARTNPAPLSSRALAPSSSSQCDAGIGCVPVSGLVSCSGILNHAAKVWCAHRHPTRGILLCVYNRSDSTSGLPQMDTFGGKLERFETYRGAARRELAEEAEFPQEWDEALLTALSDQAPSGVVAMEQLPKAPSSVDAMEGQFWSCVVAIFVAWVPSSLVVPKLTELGRAEAMGDSPVWRNAEEVLANLETFPYAICVAHALRLLLGFPEDLVATEGEETGGVHSSVCVVCRINTTKGHAPMCPSCAASAKIESPPESLDTEDMQPELTTEPPIVTLTRPFRPNYKSSSEVPQVKSAPVFEVFPTSRIGAKPCTDCAHGFQSPACDNDPPTCGAWNCSMGGPPCFGTNYACACNSDSEKAVLSVSNDITLTPGHAIHDTLDSTVLSTLRPMWYGRAPVASYSDIKVSMPSRTWEELAQEEITFELSQIDVTKAKGSDTLPRELIDLICPHWTQFAGGIAFAAARGDFHVLLGRGWLRGYRKGKTPQAANDAVLQLLFGLSLAVPALAASSGLFQARAIRHLGEQGIEEGINDVDAAILGSREVRDFHSGGFREISLRAGETPLTLLNKLEVAGLLLEISEADVVAQWRRKLAQVLQRTDLTSASRRVLLQVWRDHGRPGSQALKLQPLKQHLAEFDIETQVSMQLRDIGETEEVAVVAAAVTHESRCAVPMLGEACLHCGSNKNLVCCERLEDPSDSIWICNNRPSKAEASCVYLFLQADSSNYKVRTHPSNARWGEMELVCRQTGSTDVMRLGMTESPADAADGSKQVTIGLHSPQRTQDPEQPTLDSVVPAAQVATSHPVISGMSLSSWVVPSLLLTGGNAVECFVARERVHRRQLHQTAKAAPIRFEPEFEHLRLFSRLLALEAESDNQELSGKIRTDIELAWIEGIQQPVACFQYNRGAKSDLALRSRILIRKTTPAIWLRAEVVLL